VKIQNTPIHNDQIFAQVSDKKKKIEQKIDGETTRIEQILSDANRELFKKVEFSIEGTVKEYAPVYNWFNVEKCLSQEEKKHRIKFICIICKKSKIEKLGKTGNLLKHLAIHHESKKWVEKYRIHIERSLPVELDKNTCLLIRFFIDSNVAIQSLKDISLCKLLPFKEISPVSFKNAFLPKMIIFMRKKIEAKLDNAIFINLIADNWKSKSGMSFVGLSAAVIDNSFKTEYFVMGKYLFCDLNKDSSISACNIIF
jgi:hypothetical protein